MGHKKPVLSYVNNKSADQPAHPRSLMNAFVVRCLFTAQSHITRLAHISNLSVRGKRLIVTCTPV